MENKDKALDVTKNCDNCGTEFILGSGNMMIHSMQKDASGKGVAYKTTYLAGEQSPCRPCRKYSEKELDEGSVECDFNLVAINK